MHDEILRNIANLANRNAALRFEVSLLALALKAGFRPDQPRVPAGSPDGGRWMEEGRDGDVRLVSSRNNRTGGQVRINGRWQTATADQQARLAVSQGRLKEALRAVRKVDPKWKPKPQAYETIEGYIRANETNAAEAHFRIFELRGTRIGPGPYAAEWIPAPPTNRRLNKSEQREIDRLFRKYGCHRCGTKNPGTKSGSAIGDHQWPKSQGTPLRIYPHCASCSYSQGGLTSQGRY